MRGNSNGKLYDEKKKKMPSEITQQIYECFECLEIGTRFQYPLR